MIAALPQAGQDAGLGIGEHRRAVNDASLVRALDRDLDHIDPKQRGLIVTPRRSSSMQPSIPPRRAPAVPEL
jgi:hypothetical protein